MRNIFFVFLFVALTASVAFSQTNMSGVALCSAADLTYKIRVGDSPGHAYGLAQGTCKWTTPWEIAGIKNVEGVGTQIQEIMGDKMKVRGTFVDTMANGDKAYYNFEFDLVTKTDGAHAMNHKWELVGGTGKLNGIKGKGTCKGTPAGTSGDTNYECQGNYTFP